MARLLKSTAIFAFARSTNFALLLLSPVLLVRFLDAGTFGRYREFLVYATLTSMLAAFSAKTNLLYFVPRDPERSRVYVSNTNWIVLATSAVAVLVLVAGRDLLLARASYDFLLPLVAYVLLFTNLDFLESWWMARKEPYNVLWYSVSRTALRLGTIVAVAAVSPTIESLLTALVAVEAVRVVAVTVIMRHQGLRFLPIDRELLPPQLAFIVPLGLAASLHYLNQYAGQLAVATQLGSVALAVYTIGSYQVPVLTIIRGSVNDAIFPDMVREAADRKGDHLRLWKRSNVAYTSLIVPAVVLLFFYADVLIPVVFTEQYRESVPIFRIMIVIMLLQCFEFSSPLRAINRNGVLLAANGLMLVANLGLIFLLFNVFPEPQRIFAPALAIVASQVLQLGFLGAAILRVHDIRVYDLMKWRSLGGIAGAAAVSAVALLAGELSGWPDWLRVPLFSAAFLLCYYVLIRRLRVEEVDTLVSAVTRRFQRA